MLRAVDFDVQFEILPFLRRLDVGRAGTALTLDHRVIVDQFSVLRATHLLFWTLPMGSQPVRSLPLKIATGVVHALGMGRFSAGARTAGDLRTRSFAALFDAREFVRPRP